jgi:hypothetical protein
MAGETFDFGSGRDPVTTVAFKVPSPSRDAFFAGLKSFAQANGFDIRIARIDPIKEEFAIDMSRKDIAVSSENVFDPLDFRVDFYADPSRGGSAEIAQSMVDELKRRLAIIPDVTLIPPK